MILSGEQGSAKSTTAQTLRDLIDPAQPSTRSTPNSEQDLVIAALHNHVLSFDNLSTVRPAMADAFCRIATGGGFGTRKLHSDSDEVLFNATRPCLLNGIPDLAARPDLADRSIGIHLPVIPAAKRKTLGAFSRDFAEAKPYILGALLDALLRLGILPAGRDTDTSASLLPQCFHRSRWPKGKRPPEGGCNYPEAERPGG